MTRKGLRALARYASVFARDDFAWGRWIDRNYPRGRPHFLASDEATAFVEEAYTQGWVIKNFPWAEWITGAEAARLHGEPGAIETATVDQLGKLLTSCIRGDRYRGGTLAEVFEAGLLTRIAKRAAVLTLGGLRC